MAGLLFLRFFGLFGRVAGHFVFLAPFFVSRNSSFGFQPLDRSFCLLGLELKLFFFTSDHVHKRVFFLVLPGSAAPYI